MNTHQRTKKKKLKQCIKKARKPNKPIPRRKIIVQHQIPFEDLPDDMINKIASFLELSSYTSFEILNERICKILHNPYSLSSLHLCKPTMLSPSYKYNKITQLTIDISQMHQNWPIETTTKWNHIDSLSIKAPNVSTEQLFQVLFSGGINFISVKTLKIYNLQIDWTDFYQCAFLFPNIVGLRLHKIDFTDVQSDDDDSDQDEKIDEYIGLKQIFPKLKALKISKVSDITFSVRMYQVFGPQLRSFICDDMSYFAKQLLLNTKIFGLIEIRAPIRTLSVILKQTNNLKRVQIDSLFSFEPKLADVISNLLREQCLLECIAVYSYERLFTNFIAVMTDQLIGLRSEDIQTKRPLKMIFDIGNMTDFGEFKSNVLKIVTVLDYYTEYDWMVIVECVVSTEHMICMSNLVLLCRKKYVVNQRSKIFDIRNRKKFRIVILNKKCKISGYGKRWLL